MITVSDEKLKGKLAKLRKQNTKFLQRGCFTKEPSHRNELPEKSRELEAHDMRHKGVKALVRNQKNGLKLRIKHTQTPRFSALFHLSRANCPSLILEDAGGFLFYRKSEWLHTQDPRPRGSRVKMCGN